MKVDDLDKNLVNDIIRRIAISYPFSTEDVYSAFYSLKSFDATIRLCESTVWSS